jgi:transposase InsO family protein
VVAWDVAEVESAEIAAELVQRACLKERYCRPRGFGSRQSHQQPLILHADNGNAMRAATLESRLEELGVLRSFSRPRVSNDNPYSESLFRTVKFRPDYPSRPFASKAEACEWVAASSSSHLTNATAVPPSPSARNAPRSTKRLARPTLNAGANPLAAGANQ